jgi:hypothetical protein
VERLICPSSQGDLPAINPPQNKQQWIHLFQQKATAPKVHHILLLQGELVHTCKIQRLHYTWDAFHSLQISTLYSLL